MSRAGIENLSGLSKEQLIQIIEDYAIACSCIGEVCVDVSKSHISSDMAICKIRSYLNTPSCYNFVDSHLSDYVNLQMGKITPEQYRDIVLG